MRLTQRHGDTEESLCVSVVTIPVYIENLFVTQDTGE